MWTLVVFCLVTALVVLDIARRRVSNSAPRPSLPPGPRGLPFIGNVSGVYQGAAWLMYARWAEKYGDLIYTRSLGRDIIIINSEAIAKELLERRSKNYSDRPYLAAKSLCGRDFSTILMEYGDRWRLHRRFFHQTFRNEAVDRFAPLQRRKAHQLLRRLLDAPDQFSKHVFEYTASVILNSVYEYDPGSQKDELLDVIEKAAKATARAMRPEISILVGAFPAFLRLPSWLPGMSFKRDMAIAKASSKRYIEQPFQYFLSRKPSVNNTVPCMVSDALRTATEKGSLSNPEWMNDLSQAAATGFVAASDTSHSAILLFLLMMLMNPEVQKKAQAQIDNMVGRNRLPMIEDRSSLPYIDAVLRETLRYTPVVPLSIPHAVVEDDIYGGYHIPKGAIVIANLWSMAHDESKYPNSHEFIPERFLLKDGTLKPNDVENVVYGFGRRMCAGKYFADASLWSVMVNILAVFKIEKAKDEHGKDIPVELKFTNGVVIQPVPFRCKIVPRTPGMSAEQLQQLIDASSS